MSTRPIGLTLALAGVLVATSYLHNHTLDPRILQFVIGISAMRYYVGRDKLPVFLLTVATCVAVIVLGGSPLNALLGGLTAVCIVFVRVPRIRWLAGLGLISYSLYLLHVPIGGRVVNLGRRFGEGFAYEMGLTLVAIIVSLIAAYIFYLCVERPAIRWSKRISTTAAASRPVDDMLTDKKTAAK